jgi:hypothetical protein
MARSCASLNEWTQVVTGLSPWDSKVCQVLSTRGNLPVAVDLLRGVILRRYGFSSTAMDGAIFPFLIDF